MQADPCIYGWTDTPPIAAGEGTQAMPDPHSNLDPADAEALTELLAGHGDLLVAFGEAVDPEWFC